MLIPLNREPNGRRSGPRVIRLPSLVLGALLTAALVMLPAGWSQADTAGYLRPTAAFSPPAEYALSFPAAWSATLKALASHDIPVQASDMGAGTITTGYIDGPTQQHGANRIHIRYRFNLSVSKLGANQSAIAVAAIVEVSQLELFNQWKLYQDITTRNPAIANAASGWLAEQIVNAAGGSIAGGQSQQSAAAATNGVSAASQIDVSGVKLGMTVAEVRAVLKAKHLPQYREWKMRLGYFNQIQGTMEPVPNGQFITAIAAWNPGPPAVANVFNVDAEAYFVELTPVPGHEMAMRITHTVGYSPSDAVLVTTLEDALAQKYGDFTRSTEHGIGASPTWVFRSGAPVSHNTNAPCGVNAGGMGVNYAATEATSNLALEATIAPLELRECGYAEVGEMSFVPNGTSPLADRLVTRFTVVAYSPAIVVAGHVAAATLIAAAKAQSDSAIGRGAQSKKSPIL